MSLIELSTHATHEAVDWIRATLATIVPEVAIVVIPLQQPNQNDSWAVIVQLYLQNNNSVRTRIEAIINSLSALHRVGMIGEMQIAEIEKESAAALALHSFEQRVGRFVVATAEHYSNTNEVLLKLEPSLAFGSGLHPATRLSLSLIDRHLTSTMTALDLGCGTGILSVAIAKLGAQVVAIDNDPIAVKATKAAIALNHVTAQVKVMQASLGAGSHLGHWLGGDVPQPIVIQPAAQFDLIVANILARIHISLAAEYRQALRQTNLNSGLLITAGFATDYAEAVDAALTQAGFAQIDREQIGEWVGFVHQGS